MQYCQADISAHKKTAQLYAALFFKTYFRNLLIKYTRIVRMMITVKILSIPFHITSSACIISSEFIEISPFSYRILATTFRITPPATTEAI